MASDRNAWSAKLLSLVAVFLSVMLSGCSPVGTMLPPGEIPSQHSVAFADEQFGHQVFQQLAKEYRVSRDDAKINRVRDIVERIVLPTSAAQNPWHVYVFEDDQTLNAAATRGNYIFVWSGIMQRLQSDDELAVVLAHEVAHVLAGHVQPTPGEEARAILSGVAGEIATQVLLSQGGSAGAAAQLAGALTAAVLQAALVNPEQQRKELEADQVGLFLMADSGFDPSNAVRFWESAERDPAFGGSGLGFLSTHPTSRERLNRLRALLPQAALRYEAARARTGAPRGGSPVQQSGSTADRALLSTRSSSASEQRNRTPETFSFGLADPRTEEPVRTSPSTRATGRQPSGTENASRQWRVVEPTTTIFAAPSRSSEVRGRLSQDALVDVEERRGEWLRISNPQAGFVLGQDLSPIRR